MKSSAIRVKMVREYSINHPVKKLKINLYLKVCNTDQEVEGFIRKMKQQNKDSLDHISVLGKVRTCPDPAFTRPAPYINHFHATDIDYIHIPEIGKVFVTGYLSSLLLEKIAGKALGSLDGGLVGILTGYGVTNKKSLQYIEHLKQGKHIVVTWEYAKERSR